MRCSGEKSRTTAMLARRARGSSRNRSTIERPSTSITVWFVMTATRRPASTCSESSNSTVIPGAKAGVASRAGRAWARGAGAQAGTNVAASSDAHPTQPRSLNRLFPSRTRP